MWFNESVFYQIYTLNFCGAPRDNDGIVEHRILRLNDFMDYFEDLGINAIYFNPVFQVIIMVMIQEIIVKLMNV